jgi:heme/copper-type cytochrome/quinol oxidase subunit 2
LVRNHSRSRQSPRFPRFAGVLAAILLLLGASPAMADDMPWYKRWWLPQNFSKHGVAVDLLFTVIFIVTMAIGIAVFFFMIRYCIKYRYRSSVAKAHFTHGNKKLELIWTIIPTILLLALALWSKGAWEAFRESPTQNDKDRCRIMVIAEQFNWNVIYPGPDGKLGKYLIFPKTTDTKWPKMPPGDADDLAVSTGYPGPAYMASVDAQKILNDYIQNKNPLGKDFDDPDGKDDDWAKFPGRPIEIPKGRPVEIVLSSKDVIHSFFLPDYRVKLDAVPGMRGRIFFTATQSSKDLEDPTRRKYSLDELQAAVDVKIAAPIYRAIIPAGSEEKYSATTTHTVKKQKRQGTKVVTVEEEVSEKTQVVKDQDQLTIERIGDLRKLGIREIDAYRVKMWDLVCEELCGNGHTKMQGYLIVLEPDEYAKKYEGKSVFPATAPAEVTPPAAPPTPPATAPAASPPATAPTTPSEAPAKPTTPAPPATSPASEPTTTPAPPATIPAVPAPATESTPRPATEPATKPVEPESRPATQPATPTTNPATQPSGAANDMFEPQRGVSVIARGVSPGKNDVR